MNFITKAISKFFGGNKYEKDVKDVLPLVNQINEIYPTLSSLSNDELRGKTQFFRNRITDFLQEIDKEIESLKSKAKTDANLSPDDKEAIYAEVDKLIEEKDKALEEVLMEILPDAFAVVKETARRFSENKTLEATATDLDRELSVEKNHITINGNTVSYANSWEAAGNLIEWNMIHYDVQLIGGIVLHSGKIAEMQTGEGKTLVATLPAYLNGLTGEGVHIVTVNNYLARRDSEWMGGLLNFLGLTVDCIDNHQPNSESRRAAYNSDIIYGTNNEFGFDYLRDNMTRFPEELVQRKHHYAMIDEVDSVLVDDARTPLIISGPVEKGDQHEFHELKPRVEKIISAQRKLATQCLTEAKKLIAEGKKGVEEGGLYLLRAHRGYPKYKPLIKFMSETGIRSIMQKAENHYMAEQNKLMHIVDDELFFHIDEKQNTIDLTEKGINLITGAGDDPNFFIIPDLGVEIKEIEDLEVSDEEKVSRKDKLIGDYSIKSERIHSVQQLLKAYALFEKEVEYVVMDGKVKIVDEQTGRIMDGRRFSDGLHQALEAKENVKVEAATQTYATVTLQNYFRMYHKLAGMTGTAETEAGEFWEIYKLDVVVIPTNRPIARDDRDDLVFKTVKEKFNAVIDEIGVLVEEGRPVLVGTTTVETSELLSRMMNMRKIPHNVLNAKQHAREADIVAEAGRAGQVTIATNMAGRGTDIKLGEGVKEAGGLAIIGTERHDSRRVDRQLRGRAGRQGDPGSSQFYVSLEDNLMRLFGSERIASLMDRMGHTEGEVIQHSMITKSIERAQKKVEENNFGIRKRLLEYDDVMNNQRSIIYKRRKHALFGDRLTVDIFNTFYDLAEEIVQTHHGAQDYAAFQEDILRYFSMQTEIPEDDFRGENEQTLTTTLFEECEAYYHRRMENIRKGAWPSIERIYKERGETIKYVPAPFSDGKKVIQVVSRLQDAYDTEGRELITALEKNVSLNIIDNFWKDNLREMDELKQAVQLAVHEQKDPLLIYKFESFEMFKQMFAKVNREITSFLFRAQLPQRTSDEIKGVNPPNRQTDMSRMKTTRSDDGGMQRARQSSARQSQREQNRPEPAKVGPKVGRNEPCPCGSGKKYKQCHGKK